MPQTIRLRNLRTTSYLPLGPGQNRAGPLTMHLEGVTQTNLPEALAYLEKHVSAFPAELRVMAEAEMLALMQEVKSALKHEIRRYQKYHGTGPRTKLGLQPGPTEQTVQLAKVDPIQGYYDIKAEGGAATLEEGTPNRMTGYRIFATQPHNLLRLSPAPGSQEPESFAFAWGSVWHPPLVGHSIVEKAMATVPFAQRLNRIVDRAFNRSFPERSVTPYISRYGLRSPVTGRFVSARDYGYTSLADMRAAENLTTIEQVTRL